MNKAMCLLAALLLAGCGNRETPVAPPTPTAATNAAVQHSQPEPGFGSAAVDVITQRNKIEAGRKAKATLEAAAASENKEIEAVLNE